MDAKIFNIQGEETGKKTKLVDSIFGIEPNEHAIYLDVKQFLAANRQGTHKSKERGEISGSTRKIKRQKGTGTARAGSIKSPVFRGGGRIFGPQPRNYDFKLNKKLKRLARKSAFSLKAKEGQITVVEKFNFEEPKTKSFSHFLNNFDALNKKSLLVVDEENKNLYLSSRNLQGVKTVTASQLNTYDLIRASKVFITDAAIGKIEEILK